MEEIQTERYNKDECSDPQLQLKEWMMDLTKEENEKDGIVMWYIDWTEAGDAAKKDINQFVDPPCTYERRKRAKPDPEPKPIAVGVLSGLRTEQINVDRELQFLSNYSAVAGVSILVYFTQFVEKQKEAERLRKKKENNEEDSLTEGSDDEHNMNVMQCSKMYRLTEQDIIDIRNEFGQNTFIPEEQKQLKKRKPRPEKMWWFDPWKQGLTDRFGEVPRNQYNRHIGRRRNERFPGEFGKGTLVEKGEQETDKNLEYFTLTIHNPADPEYAKYKWAKVDCDIEYKLAEKQRVEQWPTFWFIDRKTGEKTYEMHGYERQKLKEWMVNPKDSKIGNLQEPQPLPPYVEEKENSVDAKDTSSEEFPEENLEKYIALEEEENKVSENQEKK